LDLGDRSEKEKSRMTSRCGNCFTYWWCCYFLRQKKLRESVGVRRVQIGLSEIWGAYLKYIAMYMDEFDEFGA
jgi:hypothetical protein